MDEAVRRIGWALAAYFHPDEVRWKPQAVSGERALAVAYVSARAVMERLDEVVGPAGWADSYERIEGGAVICRLSLRLGGEWVTKEDVGSQSEQPDEGDRKKAGYSDGLKRAAIKFGVGRYLYSLPQRWCAFDPKKKRFAEVPALPEWACPPPPAERLSDEELGGLDELLRQAVGRDRGEFCRHFKVGRWQDLRRRDLGRASEALRKKVAAFKAGAARMREQLGQGVVVSSPVVSAAEMARIDGLIKQLGMSDAEFAELFRSCGGDPGDIPAAPLPVFARLEESLRKAAAHAG